MTHIVQVIQVALHSAMDSGDANPSALLHSSTLDKKTVLSLNIFNGDDKDFFLYHDLTMNKLGQAGLACYLMDKKFAKENNIRGRKILLGGAMKMLEIFQYYFTNI
jgi:hypothetical protein